METRRPTFLGIGAHKAGTSWLHRQLIKHPDIWLPPRKELHFFDRSPQYPSPNNLATTSPFSRLIGSKPWERPKLLSDATNIARNLAKGRVRDAAWWSKVAFGYYDETWYCGLFSQARSGAACGEITPAYSMLDRGGIDRIAVVNPEMKFIFMIRHPVERCWSAMRFDISRGALNLNLNAAAAINSYLEQAHVKLRADYERTLENYMSRFDSKQILVCFYDAIESDPVGLLSSITAFLNVAPFPTQRIDSQTRVNASPMREMPEQVRDCLWATYSPMIRRLAGRFGSYAVQWNASHPQAYADRAEKPAYSEGALTAALHP